MAKQQQKAIQLSRLSIYKTRLVRLFVTCETFLRQHWSVCYWLTIAACGVLATTRRPDVLFHAQFWAEDGAVWYTDAYQKGFIHPLFETYAGYLAIIHRLVAGLSLLLPFHLVPLFFNSIGLICLLLPVTLIASNRFTKIIPYRTLAIVISVIYIGTLNNAEIFGNLANIQWTLSLTAFLVIVAEPTKKLQQKIFDYAILIAAAASGPSMIILIPLALLAWWRTKQKNTLIYSALLTVISCVQIMAILFFSHYSRIGAQSDANILDLAKMLVGQIFVGGVLGVKYVTYYYTTSWVLYTFMALGLLVVAYAILRGPRWLKLFSIFWPLMVLSMLMSLKPVAGFNVWDGLTNPLGGQRYWFIPICGWVATLLWLTFAAKNLLFRTLGTVLLALLLVVGIPQSWHIDPLPNLDFQAYARRFEEVPRGIKYSIPINPGWQMKLYKH